MIASAVGVMIEAVQYTQNVYRFTTVSVHIFLEWDQFRGFAGSFLAHDTMMTSVLGDSERSPLWDSERSPLWDSERGTTSFSEARTVAETFDKVFSRSCSAG